MEPARAREILEGTATDSPAVAVMTLHEARAQLDLDDPKAQAVNNEMFDRTTELLVANPELDFEATQWTPSSADLRVQYGVPVIDSPGLRQADAEDPDVTPERLEAGARQLADAAREDESPGRAGKRAQAVSDLRERAAALRVVRNEQEAAERLARSREAHPNTRNQDRDR